MLLPKCSRNRINKIEINFRIEIPSRHGMAHEVFRRRFSFTKRINHSAGCTSTACFEKGTFWHSLNRRKNIFKTNYFVFKQLSEISKEVMAFSVVLENGTSIGWNNICFPIPNVAEFTDDDQDAASSRRKRSTRDSTLILSNVARQLHRIKRVEHPFNPSVDLPQFIFCSIVENLPIGCMIQNFLELWDFNVDKIKDLSKQDILNALHTTHRSLTTGHEANFERLLGGVTRNESGHIVAAKGLLTNWMVYINFSNVNHDKVGNSAGTEGIVRELNRFNSFSNRFGI